MNKLKAFFFLFLFAGIVQQVAAQNSISKVSYSSKAESTSPSFIEGISFTPAEISQNTNVGEEKNLKPATVAAAIITKESGTKSELASSIEMLSAIQFKYAMILDVDVESLKNLSLFGFIEKWMGTRYHMGGTTNRGIDCSALTGSLLMAVYGFSVPRTARAQYKASQHIRKNNLKEGDLVFFNTRGGVSHVGLYLENNYFVHASCSDGVTISNLDDAYYAKRFIGGGRIE